VKRHTLVSFGVALAILTSAVLAQKPIACPAKNQTAKLQKDDGECLTAKQNTGIDPAASVGARATAERGRGSWLQSSDLRNRDEPDSSGCLKQRGHIEYSP
jgi:hypothetical protein